MPSKRLPTKLVRRLRRVGAKIGRAFHHLPTADHRTAKDDQRLRNQFNVLMGVPGFAVRGFNVQRNYRRSRMVVKHTPAGEAISEIKFMRATVAKHNRSHSPTDYYLLKPIAHPITPQIIAMKRVDYPSVIEVLSDHPTPRGLIMRQRLRKKGITEGALERLAELVFERTSIDHRNLLIIGIKQGKPVFLPLVDSN